MCAVKSHFYRVAGVYIGPKVTFGLLVVIKLIFSPTYFSGENNAQFQNQNCPD